MIKRGEIYWVNLDPTIGVEIRKTRPALVVSNDINNLHGATVTVLPLSTRVGRIHPFEVLLSAGSFGHAKTCKAKADQIRTVDKRRLGELLGILPPELLDKCDEAIRLHLALD